MSYSETITYDTAASLNFDTTLVQVSAGAVQLKASGGLYSITNPVVTSQHQNTISALSGFSQSVTLPANTAIQYQLVLNGANYWYNATAAAWQASDGTYTQSNTAAIINSNASTLFSSLSLLVPQFLGIRAFLHTSNTASTPILTSNTVTYTWTNSNPAVISQCLITCYLSDLLGQNIIPASATPISLRVGCDHAFLHGSRFVAPFSKSVNFDGTGTATISVIETATPGVALSFVITYYDGKSLVSSKLFNAIVPNQPAETLNSISSLIPYSFG